MTEENNFVVGHEYRIYTEKGFKFEGRAVSVTSIFLFLFDFKVKHVFQINIRDISVVEQLTIKGDQKC